MAGSNGVADESHVIQQHYENQIAPQTRNPVAIGAFPVDNEFEVEDDQVPARQIPYNNDLQQPLIRTIPECTTPSQRYNNTETEETKLFSPGELVTKSLMDIASFSHVDKQPSIPPVSH